MMSCAYHSVAIGLDLGSLLVFGSLGEESRLNGTQDTHMLQWL